MKKSPLIDELAMSIASYRKQLSRCKLDHRYSELTSMYLNGRIDSLISLAEEMKIKDEVEDQARFYMLRLIDSGCWD